VRCPVLAGKVSKDILTLQRSWVEAVGRGRGGRFRVGDWLGVLKTKLEMECGEGQSEEVFELYRFSAKAGYDSIRELTDYVRPEDEAWLERFQTSAVLEILYELDGGFREASVRVAEALRASRQLIAEEALSRIYGRYGSTWIVDYTPTPGSLLNLLSRVIEASGVGEPYRQMFMNLVSCTRATAYATMFGSRMLRALEEGLGVDKGARLEAEELASMFLRPMEAQARLAEECGLALFDYWRCMEAFKGRIYEAVQGCVEAGVHYSNILSVSRWGSGDFHHVSQTSYNLFKGDMEYAILRALTGCLERTLEGAVERGLLRGVETVPTWQVTASASAYIMRLDGFTSHMILELLERRFRNLALGRPSTYMRECMCVEFTNFLRWGERFIEAPPRGFGCRVNGVKIDLTAVDEDEVLSNPQRYTWPECPITVRFSSLLKFADEPFHLYSDPAICLYMTEAISLKPEESRLPLKICKECSQTTYLPNMCKYCLSEGRP
jgi:hypothetical protein